MPTSARRVRIRLLAAACHKRCQRGVQVNRPTYGRLWLFLQHPPRLRLTAQFDLQKRAGKLRASMPRVTFEQFYAPYKELREAWQSPASSFQISILMSSGSCTTTIAQARSSPRKNYALIGRSFTPSQPHFTSKPAAFTLAPRTRCKFHTLHSKQNMS